MTYQCGCGKTKTLRDTIATEGNKICVHCRQPRVALPPRKKV